MDQQKILADSFVAVAFLYRTISIELLVVLSTNGFALLYKVNSKVGVQS